MITLQVAALFAFLISPVFATSLDSTNYKMIDYDLNFGGGRSAGTTNTLYSDIELVITAQITPEPTPEPGNPPPPPPPPPPGDTTPPVISNVQAINIALTSATITWDTDETATSYVEYGKTTAYGASVSGTTSTMSHSLDLAGLIPETLYHFRVKSTDSSNNEAVSSDYTFTTLTPEDVTPPIISNIRVENITGISATVLWDTNEPATSLVNYGLNTSYGKTKSKIALTTTHQIELTGLTPDTLYHFQVQSVDGNNNTATSADQSFRTLDTIPPTISNIQVINITDRSATITWVTNEATTSRIFYRRQGTGAYSILVDDNLLVSHFNTLTGLIANIVYEFYIIAQDASGNTAQSPVQTFKTLPDNIPPANIRNFTATPDDSLNVLTWQNPTNPDFAGVRIMRSTSTYPRNIREGDFVYVGTGVSVTDSGLTNGVKYYYTGFAYDTSINYASGAITDGTPIGPEEEIPEEELPPEEIPPPVVPPTVNLDAVSFFVANRTIGIFPDANNSLEMIAGVGLGVSLDKTNLPDDIELATLRVNNSNYLLKLRADESAYDVDIVLPPAPEIYKGEITLVFEDRQQIISFGLDLKQKGIVFERKDGIVSEMDGATITLYVLESGDWKIWPGANYYQDNPMVTLADGAYAFLVPNGTFYLKAVKDGYRDRTTNRFEVERNYINQSLELLIKPKKILEVIKPEAPLAENVVAVSRAIAEQTAYRAKIVQEEVVGFVQNPVVEKANKDIAAPSLVSVAVFNAATALPFLNLWTYLQYLLTQPLLFLKRRKRKAWGVVYNAFTKLPIDLAIVRLIHAKTKQVLRTMVTDKQGRYVLFSPKGIFRLTSTKTGFQFPSVYLRGKKVDEAYADLYHGAAFDVKSEGQAVVYNLPMDPIEKKISLRRIAITRVLKGLQYGLALSGIVLTTISFIITPSWKIGAFLVLHIALFGLFVRLAKPAKFKKWGTARDSETNKPLKNVAVRLFEPEFNKLLGTQITDSKGRYAFLVGRNIFYLTFEKAGYKTLRTKKIDTRTKAKAGLITEKVKMERSKSTNKS